MLGQSWCYSPRTAGGMSAKPDPCQRVAGLRSSAPRSIRSAGGLVRRPLRFRPSTRRRGRRDARHSAGRTDPCLGGRDRRPGGHAAVRRLGDLLGGVEANRPVASTEESVDLERRRVFQPVTVDATRTKIVTASHGEHHATRAREFPFEARVSDYLPPHRVSDCLPHRDRLFQAPRTLRRPSRRRVQIGFRRTNEVPDRMARVFHRLWMLSEGSLLNMAGTIPDGTWSGIWRTCQARGSTWTFPCRQSSRFVDIDDVFRPFEIGGRRVPDLLFANKNTRLNPAVLHGHPT